MIDLSTYGRASGLERRLVARVTRTPEPDAARRHELVLVSDAPVKAWGDLTGYRALLTTRSFAECSPVIDIAALPTISEAKQVGHLRTGDVIALTPRTGHVRTLFRPDSTNNALLATDRCNSFCLMCSQPPIDRDDSDLVAVNIEAIRLMKPAPGTLGITGGEPTLLGENLFRILGEMKRCLPDTHVHMLTNGRRFAWPKFTAAFVAARHPNLTVGIPIYADNAPEHDYVVQACGAFDQTMQGLHQLARFGQPLEIRVVLHALTVPRLGDVAEFIYRNLPFAAHVAFMGLEITGFTKPNLKILWIDPYDYQAELEEAVEYLAIRGMNVSLYNNALCVLPRRLWKFARKSISDYKNIYLEACQRCAVLDQCGGLFKSAEHQHSAHIHPLLQHSA
jgi:His-Xaa-Ser system radical SAM maturase HxsC